MAAKDKSNEIRITRIFDAPVKLVWEAWTDPRQAAQWWGPRGFTITTHSKELKVGGVWHYTMHGPDGVDYPNKTRYLEIEECSRLVYDHGGSDDRPPLFRVTVELTELKGKTKMEMTMRCASAEAAEQTREIIKKANGNTTWDRLAEFVVKEASGKDQFIMNRSFEAPIELMYDLWTDPKHFAQWLPPTGFTMLFHRREPRPGGSSFFSMSGPGGMTMHGRIEYVELERPHRIVYRQQFCDENEKITRHPMSPTWPETMLTAVTLTEEGPSRTRVTISWEPHGKVTREELETFLKGRGGMTQGWTGSFDKLESYFATLEK